MSADSTSRGAYTTLATPIPVPKYYQLEEILREQVSSWAPDDPVPSEAELCKQYKVSRTTARKALEDLTREGLFYRVQGKGTFVAPPKVAERFAQHTLGFYEDMTSRGYTVQTQVLEQDVLTPPKYVADVLNLAPGEQVVKLVRLRAINDEPILISTTFLPCRLYPGLEDQDFSSQSLYALLRAQYGVKLAYGTRTVEAEGFTEEEARLLHTVKGAPLLMLKTTMFDAAGQPIEFGYARHRGDRSQIEIEVVVR